MNADCRRHPFESFKPDIKPSTLDPRNVLALQAGAF